MKPLRRMCLCIWGILYMEATIRIGEILGKLENIEFIKLFMLEFKKPLVLFLGFHFVDEKT